MLEDLLSAMNQYMDDLLSQWVGVDPAAPEKDHSDIIVLEQQPDGSYGVGNLRKVYPLVKQYDIIREFQYELAKQLGARDGDHDTL